MRYSLTPRGNIILIVFLDCDSDSIYLKLAMLELYGYRIRKLPDGRTIVEGHVGG